MSDIMESRENVNEDSLDIIESQDVSQQLCEKNESQKAKPSNDKNTVIIILSHGWKKIIKKRLMGKSKGKHDVHFESPQGTKIRSQIALVKYISANQVQVELEEFDFSCRSHLQRHGTHIVTECINKENGDIAATSSGVTEEDQVPAVDHAGDALNTEDDLFIVGDEDRNTTPIKSVGRRTSRGRRRTSERSLKEVTRNKRPRKSSSTKPETPTKKRKDERKQNSHQHIDCNQEDDPAGLCDQVLAIEDTEDQAFTPPPEQQSESEYEKTGSNSSDGDSLTSSGKTNDSITRSQVEKRKTSPYFSKQATKDVQMSRHELDSLGSRLTDSNFEESNFNEEQEPPHIADDEEADDAYTEAANNCSHPPPLSPAVFDSTNLAIAVEASQEAESEGAGPSTSQPLERSKTLVCCPTSQGHRCERENQLIEVFSTFLEEMQSKQSEMYRFAVSLVPLLENVPKERVRAVKKDMFRLICTTLMSDAVPIQSNGYP